MSERYVPISLEEINELLKEDKGWISYNTLGSEICRDFPVKNTKSSLPVSIRVFTSIAAHATVSRDCGTDAIRVVLLMTDPVTNKVTGLKKFSRVHRTKNWRDNLKSRVNEALFYVKNSLEFCPSCGKLLVERKSKFTGSFFGCSGFPACKYTRSVP